MKNVSGSDLHALAAEARALAADCDRYGDEAVRRARDWASPLRAASLEPGRGKGSHGDPTATAATSDYVDVNREQWTLLSVDAGQAFDAMTGLRSRLRGIAVDAVIENQRAGIGHCDCGRYCTGVKDDRLRNGECPACYKRGQRREAKAEVCVHPSTTWSHGRKHCNVCGVELEAATG